MDPINHPLTLWAQRKDKLFITIALEDCQEPKIDLTETKLSFSSKGGPDQKIYELELELNQEVVPKESKQLVTSREITFNIKKKTEGPYWTKLLKDAKKPHFLKTDFNKWKDEDDSDPEDLTAPDDANFEDMVNSMGGMGTGEKFDPGEADSDDSDDEELPDLEG